MSVLLRSAGWLAVAVTVLAFPVLAHGSCGSAFCSLMTDRFAQTTGASHVGWSADVRVEAVTADRLRSATSTVDAEDVHEHHIEGHTDNANAVTTLEYGIDPAWSLSFRIPVVRRAHVHTHIEHDTGEPHHERWRFTELGDVQAFARRQFTSGDGRIAYAFLGGVELPTGATDIDNDEGDEAERTLQPGSGTTDMVLGAAARWTIAAVDALIGEVTVTQAVAGRNDYEPGMRTDASVGWSHAVSRKLGTVLQLNYRYRERDEGDEAERENSGMKTVDLSPGITFRLGHNATLYAYWQLPLYQRVDGVQLVPRGAFAFGFTRDF
jgi:hypothetical protein